MIKHTPITMHRTVLNQIDDYPSPSAQRAYLNAMGDFYWQIDKGKRILVFNCPVTDGFRVKLDHHTGTPFLVAVVTIDHKNHCNASWTWDGNENKPTISPSYHWKRVWHGWIRNGELIQV